MLGVPESRRPPSAARTAAPTEPRAAGRREAAGRRRPNPTGRAARGREPAAAAPAAGTALTARIRPGLRSEGRPSARVEAVCAA